MLADNTPNVVELLGSGRGQYIPRDFVTGFDLSGWSGISEADALACRDPEHEEYWDAWDTILNNARFTLPDGRIFYLYHDEDLWALCYEEMTPEERRRFGGESLSEDDFEGEEHETN